MRPCATGRPNWCRRRWHYLYLAVDSDVNLADVYLSAAGDQPAAKAFLHSATEVIGITITTEKRSGYPPALAKVFGDDVMHGMSKRKNSQLEQGHRGIKGRIRSVA